MSRPTNTDERRGQIIGGLLKVMAKRGYDGASVGDIAKAARLTSGLVHYHFKSKREILLEAVQVVGARHQERLATRLTALGGDATSQVSAFIDFHLGLGADADPEALACWVLFSGEALRDAKVAAAFGAVLAATVETLRGLISRGVEERSFACADSAAAASAVVATIQGYFVMAAAARQLIPRGSAAVATKQMADGLIRPVRSFTT